MNIIGSFADIAEALQPWLAIIAISCVINTVLLYYYIFHKN